ncbi:hypothetical protein M983_0213 [Proteus myxofaciens ATCC 19692]|uniref:Uncharacterized protein n=1 Tax=Proteus myxofaciens ATCC 19692 TaxID=1354337 RepID=A0A198GP76_9GAMM|nr:hypothetical protein M983_0213 [Proteus myxofaciens ATCC 19692]
MTFLSELYYDSDPFWGIGGLVRYSVIFSLTNEKQKPTLITHQNENNLLLQ